MSISLSKIFRTIYRHFGKTEKYTNDCKFINFVNGNGGLDGNPIPFRKIIETVNDDDARWFFPVNSKKSYQIDQNNHAFRKFMEQRTSGNALRRKFLLRNLIEISKQLCQFYEFYDDDILTELTLMLTPEQVGMGYHELIKKICQLNQYQQVSWLTLCACFPESCEERITQEFIKNAIKQIYAEKNFWCFPKSEFKQSEYIIKIGEIIHKIEKEINLSNKLCEYLSMIALLPEHITEEHHFHDKDKHILLRLKEKDFLVKISKNHYQLREGVCVAMKKNGYLISMPSSNLLINWIRKIYSPPEINNPCHALYQALVLINGLNWAGRYENQLLFRSYLQFEYQKFKAEDHNQKHQTAFSQNEIIIEKLKRIIMSHDNSF